MSEKNGQAGRAGEPEQDLAEATPANSDPDSTTPVSVGDTGHDYDGIREHDNRLPNWWLATLFATVIFGYGYWFYYHVLDGPDQQAEYASEMAQAEAAAQAYREQAGAPDDDTIAALATEPSTVEAGAATFKQFCAACHGVQGEGAIGPNLTDAFFLHGARPGQILEVVDRGATAKGMPAWGPVLGREKLNHVVAYVLSIKGTNRPGKEPQGEPGG